MRVDMKEIEVWIEEKILYYIDQQRDSRLQRMQLVNTLTSPSDRNWHWGPLVVEQPGWLRISHHKRQNRIDKVLNRMVREHKLKIVNESGDENFSEDYTQYIYKIGLLDRIARHLEVDDN